jgi:hypothetical protein
MFIAKGESRYGNKLYFASHNLWGIGVNQIYTESGSTYLDFTITASVGTRQVFHREQARNSIIRFYGESAYEEWKRVALSQYDESMAVLMDDLAKRHPGLKAHSVTTCESAERLMARTPNVYLHRKVAFLIVPN